MAGCRAAAEPAGIPSIWGICWRRCRSCLGLIPARHGDASLRRARAAAASVTDPELPPLTIDDLGILRDVRMDGGTVEVAITPTYSGCPAMREITDAITTAVREAGVEKVRVRLVLTPAWTSDWLTDGARAKLLELGIAPPEPGQGSDALFGRSNVAVPALSFDGHGTDQRVWLDGL